MKIGKKLRRMRLERDYSQEYVALQLGVSQNTYSKIENNLLSPKLERVVQIAQIYNMDVVQILQLTATETVNDNGHKEGLNYTMILEKQVHYLKNEIQQLRH